MMSAAAGIDSFWLLHAAGACHLLVCNDYAAVSLGIVVRLTLPSLLMRYVHRGNTA